VPAPGAERDRLLLMAGKLLRFTGILSFAALAFGIWLWIGYGIGRGQGWLNAKLALVVLLIGYQHLCGHELAALRAGTSTHSHVWYRWFNEIPTVLLLLILVLVIVQPF
jgi:putative membrane protein